MSVQHTQARSLPLQGGGLGWGWTASQSTSPFQAFQGEVWSKHRDGEYQ